MNVLMQVPVSLYDSLFLYIFIYRLLALSFFLSSFLPFILSLSFYLPLCTFISRFISYSFLLTCFLLSSFFFTFSVCKFFFCISYFLIIFQGLTQKSSNEHFYDAQSCIVLATGHTRSSRPACTGSSRMCIRNDLCTSARFFLHL